MRKKWIIAIIIIVCTTVFIVFNTSRMNKSESVELVAAQEGVIQETIYATGKLSSTKETLLHIQQSGTVQQVAIQLGDRVTTGQSLLIMDTKDSEDQLLIEENNKMIIVTERELFKKQKLVTAKEKLQEGVDPKDIIDPGEIELYALRLEAVELSIAALEENIASNHLQATVDGVVTGVHIKEGQTVAKGTPAVTIVDQNLLRVKAYLNELDVSKVKVGMEAQITGDAFTTSYSGKVSYLAPNALPVDASSRDVAVELWVDVNEPDDQLRPGYNATVEIEISQTPSLLVPLSAIRNVGSRTIVFVVENDLAVEREVTAGDDDGENIEIVTGLQAGDEVITKLSNHIVAGNKVKEQ